MKKAVLFALIALLGGLALGTLFGSGISSASLNSVRATAAEYPAVSALDAIEVEGRSTLYQAAPADAGTSCLSDRAGQVLAALKESDYEALAALVHPEKGVTLTPYSTVEPSCDRNLLPAQLVLLPEDDIPYVWGIEDGTGAPIELTGREYFERYVFNADYTAAPETAVDKMRPPPIRRDVLWSITFPVWTNRWPDTTGVLSNWCLNAIRVTGIWSAWCTVNGRYKSRKRAPLPVERGSFSANYA